MSRRWAWMLIGLAATVGAQDEYRYVDQPAAGNVFALGYPVPRPVESATPIDGFRSYAALHARLQDLAMRHAFIDAAIVGQTIAGRDIWAYAIGDPGTDTVHADAESSVLVNGGIHAREWGTPELTTGLIEAFAERAGDGFLVDYLIDNVHFVVLPVNNIDGFLQTQRYPDRVLVGRDPRFPEDWPRDGRMRRKNMRGVDEDLDSRGDHLLGIDLNRNNPPFWNSGSGSSGNPDDLTYRGLASFSEPETRALENAAAFARADRLRWYQDTHSFTQKFFSVRTFNERRNAIQADMLDSYRRFHNALSLERHGVERTYLDDPDPPGAGIGVTAEYFAETYQVPSWTLEIEPRNGGVDYGGLGAEHDGFILPDSEVGRFREDMADTHLAVAYRQAGPPSLAAWRVLDAARGPVAEGEWRPAGNGLRVLDVSVYRPVVLGEALTMQLSFDKPMRWSDGGGPRQAPGHEVPFTPEVILASGTPNATVLPASEGVWLEQDVRRYRFDRFEFPLTLPTDLVLDGVETLPISVVARDFTDVALDARPETVADWADGAWTGYEDATGTAGDVGGPDRTSISLPVSATAVDALALAIPSPVMDEGRAFRLEVERTGSGTGVVETEVE
ncbi:MAG: M14 family zinc carboxypeptidase, partial [Wenzhouxiangellaceae bacterium]|nr:M14 family zinc carboxypeptidase [Wenzhouxiangellaceae bacterium]